MLGHVTPVCNNAMMALLSLYLYELLSYVVMPCCTAHTCMLCVCVTCIAMCGIRQPSCLSLVTSLMGKCSLVLPLSHGSLLQPGLPSPASLVATAPEHLDWLACDPLRS